MVDEPGAGVPARGAASGPSPHHWWQAAVLDDSGALARLLLVDSERHPDGARVPLSDQQARGLPDPVVCESVLVSGAVTHLHVSPGFAPKAPPVWFVELVPDDAPGAHDLLAFSGPGRTPGRLVVAADADPMGVTSADQLGAVRWLPGTGEIDQVYVQPEWRRRHLGSLLVTAAACLTVTRGLPRLWGDGERTELGERLRNARSWRDRTATLAHLAPPMTPRDTSSASGS